jgi:hypothetical protein
VASFVADGVADAGGDDLDADNGFALKSGVSQMSMLAIIRDPLGYRLFNARKWTGHGFLTDDGIELSAQVYPAHRANLLAAVTGNALVTVKDSYQWPVKAEEVADLLRGWGWSVDDNLRLKRKLGAPFTMIKPSQIGPLIMVHMKVCEEKKKEAERIPMWLAHAEEAVPGGKAVQCLYYILDAKAATKVPEMDDDPGQFSICNNQFCLSWHDQHLIPKTADVFMLHRWLKVTPGPESLEDLEKNHQFVSVDGMLCKSGMNALTASTLSIDEFLGPK